MNVITKGLEVRLGCVFIQSPTVPRRDQLLLCFAELATSVFLPSCLSRYFRPDTGDLALRVGIHSGPVTAGVLLGEKSRFQLFGDTVNTGKIPHFLLQPV